jgi:quercetin dioxygenase-like cupin family protein
VLLGEDWHEIREGDSVFIAGEETHRLAASPDRPLGFVCVIPSGIAG